MSQFDTPAAKAAIPTMYAGIQFRSRLEATWAAMFDLCGIRWEYEPFDLDGYIPDFVLPGEAKPEGYDAARALVSQRWVELRHMDAHERIDSKDHPEGPCHQCDAWNVQVELIEEAERMVPHYHGHIYVEVKPALSIEDFAPHIAKTQQAVGPGESVLFLGAGVQLSDYCTANALMPQQSCTHCWGVGGGIYGAVEFGWCPRCCRRGLRGSFGGGSLTMGGHHDCEDDPDYGGFVGWGNTNVVTAWAQAKNITQWNPPKGKR